MTIRDDRGGCRAEKGGCFTGRRSVARYKKRRVAGSRAPLRKRGPSLDHRDVFRLRPFLALDDIHHDFLTLKEGLSATAGDAAVMHENIRCAIAPDESEALFIIEPFDGSFDLLRHVSNFLLWFCAPDLGVSVPELLGGEPNEGSTIQREKRFT